jgi:hypothetical protein
MLYRCLCTECWQYGAVATPVAIWSWFAASGQQATDNGPLNNGLCLCKP